MYWPLRSRHWFVLGLFGLVSLLGCGASSSVGSTATATATPRATPLPTVALTVQRAYTVTDTDQLDISGSSVPGADIAIALPSGLRVTAVADPAGHFVLHLTGIVEGANEVGMSATAPGFATTSTNIAVTRTVSPAAYKSSAASIPYNQLVKDPSSMAGRVVTYPGQVFQYDSATTTQHMIASVTAQGYGYWSDNVWLDVDPSMTANICKDTIVRLWGTVVGAYSYTTTNNGNLTIPEIKVRYIEATQKAC